MSLVVAITGGIASGKTTVANLFHQHFGIHLVDADVVARQVVEPGTQGLTQIVEHFGRSILNPDGTLDRAALREKIFSNSRDKEWINNLLHPLIRQEMLRQLQLSDSPYSLLVVPLLVENGLQHMANRVLVVDVSEQTQIYRTMTRDGVPESQVRSILKAQAKREARLAHADDVINNDAEGAQLLSQITELHQKYLALCS